MMGDWLPLVTRMADGSKSSQDLDVDGVDVVGVDGNLNSDQESIKISK